MSLKYCIHLTRHWLILINLIRKAQPGRLQQNTHIKQKLYSNKAPDESPGETAGWGNKVCMFCFLKQRSEKFFVY